MLTRLLYPTRHSRRNTSLTRVPRAHDRLITSPQPVTTSSHVHVRRRNARSDNRGRVDQFMLHILDYFRGLTSGHSVSNICCPAPDRALVREPVPETAAVRDASPAADIAAPQSHCHPNRTQPPSTKPALHGNPPAQYTSPPGDKMRGRKVQNHQEPEPYSWRASIAAGLAATMSARRFTNIGRGSLQGRH